MWQNSNSWLFHRIFLQTYRLFVRLGTAEVFLIGLQDLLTQLGYSTITEKNAYNFQLMFLFFIIIHKSFECILLTKNESDILI